MLSLQFQLFPQELRMEYGEKDTRHHATYLLPVTYQNAGNYY